MISLIQCSLIMELLGDNSECIQAKDLIRPLDGYKCPKAFTI